MAQELHDEAIMYFKDAMEYDVSSNLYPLATVCFKKGDYEEAIENIQKIFTYNKNNALAHFLLAQTYEKQNKKDSASIEYMKFLKIWKNADKDLPELQMARQKVL